MKINKILVEKYIKELAWYPVRARIIEKIRDNICEFIEIAKNKILYFWVNDKLERIRKNKEISHE